MMSLVQKSSPFTLAMSLHLALLLGAGGLHFLTQRKPKKNVVVEIVEAPQLAPAQLNLQPPKPMDKPKPEKAPEQRQVFGASRKTIQTSEPSADSVAIKAGNTVAKEMDDLKLQDDDPDSIPIPADDYLITSMPVLVSVVRPPYPPEARKAEIQGAVVMEMIIDETGRVRQVKLIRGPGYGLDEAAVEAMKKAQFRPGKIGDQNVAVKFRHKYVFELGSE